MVEEKEFNILKHTIVPKHTILTEEEKVQLLQNYKILAQQLPKISATDPVVKLIGAKVGDVLKIERKSLTAGESVYYRLVKKMEVIKK